MRIGVQQLLIVLIIVIIIFGPTQIPKLTKMLDISEILPTSIKNWDISS